MVQREPTSNSINSSDYVTNSNLSIHPTATVPSDATLHNNITIHANVVIGHNTRIHDGVVIYPNTIIGDNCVILEHVTLGRPPETAGSLTRPLKPSYPPLIVGNSCLIGPSSKIYRGAIICDRVSIYEFVTIREECHIGNDVVLAPGVTVNYDTRIGDRTRVMHSTHLTGKMTIEEDVFISLHVGTTNDHLIETIRDNDIWVGAYIEKNCVIGAGAMLAPGIRVGQGSHVTMQSIITKDVPPYTLIKTEVEQENGKVRLGSRQVPMRRRPPTGPDITH
jgi:UDP-3-O-[3-hydroxymyristoyl] glucosamine N-acyltransferase